LKYQKYPNMKGKSMFILGLDCAAKAASAAVFNTETQSMTVSASMDAMRTHSEALLPHAESVLKAARLSLNDIDAFAVSHGPGSFTGVRIAVSAVKGMAFALNKPVYAVSTLHSLAYNLLGQDCVACCVMDARRGQFYNALFRVNNGSVERLTPDRAISAEELEAELQNYAGERVITAADDEVSAASVCLAASEYTPISAKELMPMYLRMPQAERERRAGAEKN
jgi:tRNA threonylcarbamoyladenosine biosynthesis protein TsaB